MTTHQTRYVRIPANPDTEQLDDVRDYDTAAEAAGTYYLALRYDHDLPVTRAGDLLYTELILHGMTAEASWHIAGEDYLLPLTEDQLAEHLGAQLVDDAASFLHAELGPGASY